MSKYPLCARAGLELMEHFAVIRAADVEKLLAGAPVIRGGYPDGENFEQITKDAAYTARLVMIERIVKDTAEALPKELIEADMTPPANEFPKKLYDILERAKRILESK